MLAGGQQICISVVLLHALNFLLKTFPTNEKRMRPSRCSFSLLLLAAGCTLNEGFVPSAPRSSSQLLVDLSSITNQRATRTAPLSPGWVSQEAVPSTTLCTSLSMASEPNTIDDDSPSWQIDPLFASLWIGFNAFAILGPFGEIGAESDTAMIMSYIDNPADPGFAEGFQLVFNLLGILPIIIACLAVPQASKRGLPPLPFLVSSFALGFGGAGPYLSFRAPPRDEFVPSEASWFTKNVLENKFVSWGLVGGILFLPFYVGLVDAIATDGLAAAWQSYTDLFVESKFVSTSSVDAVVLNVAAASLIPRDLKLRQPDIDDSKAKIVGASTLLLPFLGAALYCALRPALPTEEA